MAISVASAAACSVCGEPLNARGNCVACLLRTALDESVMEPNSDTSFVFGDFEIVRHKDGSCCELGRGAMGVTYLARDNVLRRKVALKVIDVPAAARGSQAVRERFLREARAAAALRHPNVAAVFQFGASPNGSRCFYAMELVEGETLETRVRRDGPLNAKLALQIAIQITRALMAASAQGLIHRDLKPGNIMLTRGDADTEELEVKVIDFGLAKAIADAGGEMDLTHGEFVGTPNFASPEQFESGPVDVRSDIYSLGATLWFALTGKTPFDGRSIEEIRSAQKSNALPVEQLKATRIPPSLRSLLESMLAFEPAARPGIQDLAAQLRRCSALAETETAADVKKEIQLEIAHVLFIDIVGYSKLSINEQHAAVDELTQIVRSTEQFQKAEAADRLIKIPSGDGMALVFYTSPEAPVRCAIQISRGLKDHPRLHIRMGIHSGPVRGVVDVTGRINLAGAGLNLAQRTMKCGDAGHILLSKHVAEDLSEFEEWRPLLHDLGTCEVKHGVQVAVVNLWSDDVGNRQLPQKFEALRKQRARVRWVEVAAALLLMAGIVAAFFLVSKKSARSTSVVPEKSIAVLPFENLSEDKANSYFADGVQDEILTDLARIADLKVISRISVMHYKSGIARNLREIGQQLGVANVLEGSVQRSGNRVRVNAQLFDARSDRPLWGQTYDRDLADVFAIQSEIAKAIADQLRAKLSPSEKNAIELPPTTDIPAFDLYTRARNLYLIAYMKGGAGNEDLLQAADLLNQAVARDPSFFQAYCQLAFTHDSIYGLGWDHTPARLAQAEAAVQAAARLRPEAGETHLARARNLYFGYLDYDAALAELEIAGRMMPGDSWVPLLKGAIERRRGYWDDSIRDMERAIELDPQNVLTLQQTTLSYKCLRRYAEEKSTLARVLAFEPDDAVARVWQAFVELDSKADTYPLHQTIDSIKGANPTAISRFAQAWIFCGLAERDGAAAKNALAAFGENPISFGLAENMIFNRPFAEGIIARMTKDDAKAQAAFTAARAEQEKIIQAQPNYGPALCVLGLIDAGLGRKEQALREGRRAVELLPVGKDAVEGANMLKYLAIIAAWVGEKDLACEQLSSVVRRPSSLSYGQLKLLPFWDPLRGDPRFEKLVEEAKLPVALSASASGARNAANFAPAPEKSIAVLPFENASNEPNTEYLSEGISEALINSLSELEQLRVIARPTAFRYKRKDIDPRQVGRELGVAAVLTGKVRQMQDALNVQVDLVDAVTGAQILGAGYDRKIADLVAVKQAIAQEVTAKLKLKLSSDEQRRLVKRDSTNPEAYQFYLRGRYFWNKRTSDGIRQAIEHFQQSVERDPNFALGYVGLADSYIALTFYNFAAPHETMPKAKESAIKALALDDTLAEAHASLAHTLMNYDWNWSAAEKEFKRSIELKPDYATAHEWYAIHYLTATGRLEEAVQEMKKALELEPASLVMNTFMGATLYYAGRYDEAIDQCRRTIQMDPNFAVAHWHLGLAYEEKQILDAAIEEFKKAISLSGGSPLMRAALGRAYAKSQKKNEASEMLNELNELAKRQYVSAYEIATIYVALSNNEQAFQLLEEAYGEHSFHLAYLNVSPQFKPVISDRRFQDLVQRIGLSR
jgi:TolB-like protein/serine/threonine protein kinase/predicted Zn-dependent protease